MSLRISTVHQCHDQNRVMAFMSDFLNADVAVPALTLKDFTDMWAQAAESLGETRPARCRCSFRVTSAEAEALVENGIAQYLITEWRFNADKRVFFPAPNPNLVWGGKQAEDLGLVRASFAAKTPRVQTIEKAHIERAYVDGKQEDIERIEEWGRLAKQVLDLVTVEYEKEPFDPFKGCPVVSIPPGWDQRTCPGVDVKKEKT